MASVFSSASTDRATCALITFITSTTSEFHKYLSWFLSKTLKIQLNRYNSIHTITINKERRYVPLNNAACINPVSNWMSLPGATSTSNHFSLLPNLSPLFLQNISCASYRAIFYEASKDLKVMATYVCVCLQSLQDDGDLRRPYEHGRYGPRKVSLMVF